MMDDEGPRWVPTRFGGLRRTGVVQTRQERHSDGVDVGSSHLPPGTNPTGFFAKARFSVGKHVSVRWAEHLGLPTCPYVIRWMVETPLGSLRVHHWLGPDDDRALHDHPWWFLTFVVKGGYADLQQYGVADLLQAPAVRFRPAHHQHTVQPLKGGAWTVMVTGPKVRVWGFWQDNKFTKANKWFLTRGHHPCS
jgi:hypothetical protein